MSQRTPLANAPDQVDTTLLVAGTLLVLLSLAAAAWLLSLGDFVTAAGLGLLVVSGLLLTGIGLSPDAATH